MARKTLTLDDINAAADEQFGTLDIPVGDSVIKLVNPLRLTEGKRKALKEWLDDKTKEGEEAEEKDERPTFDQAADVLFIVAEEEWMADKLKNALGRDQARLKIVIDEYFEREQAGKASSSQS